jgi:hypothetical protein
MGSEVDGAVPAPAVALPTPASSAVGPGLVEVPTAGRLDTRALRTLQRTAGNAQVARFLQSRRSLVARQQGGGDAVADPVEVEWSKDRFRISFAREGEDRFEFTVRYLGSHRTDGPFVSDGATRLSVGIGPKPLQPKVVSTDATSVAVDLYGDGTKVVELVDQASLDQRRGSVGREHSLRVMDRQAAVFITKLTVLDATAKAEDITQAGPLEFPGDRPDTGLRVAAGRSQFVTRIDGDGDEDKELELGFSAVDVWPDPTMQDAVKTLRLAITQRSTGTTSEALFDVPRSAVGGNLFPLVKDVTDGHAPTQLDLVLPSGSQVLQIAPGVRGPADTRYRVSLGAQSHEYVFPVDPRPQRRVAGTAPPVVAGGVVSWDVSLGAYSDRFRLTIRKLADHRPILGISALSGSEPNGTVGLELAMDGPVSASLVDTGPISLGLDLDGDRKPDLLLFDQLTTPGPVDGGGPPARSRDHRIRLVGPAVGGERTFDFSYRHEVLQGGYATPGAADVEAARNAEAVGVLSKQAGEGGRRAELDALELRMQAIRRRAADRKVVSPASVDALAALWQALVVARPEMPNVERSLKDKAYTAASSFSVAYGREFPNLTFAKVAAMGQLKGAINSDGWGLALGLYRMVAEHFDRLVLERMEDKEGTGSQDFKAATAFVAESSELASVPGDAIRVPASYHPDQRFSAEDGYAAVVPLTVWVWKDGGTWRLKDLTSPTKPFTYSLDDASATPPLALFAKLDDPDHFPAGVVNFGIPGGLAGRVPVRDSLTWKKFFTYLGIGLAVVGAGLSLATPAGPVAVAGAWALAGSALAGAIAAGIDLAEHIQHDNLDAQTATIDLLQVVAGLAGFSALASGRIVVSAAAVPAGARWTGAWARVAVLSSKIYLPATVTAAAADVATFAVISVQTASQLDAIENGTGTPDGKSRAKLLLLTQVAIMGGLTALSVKGVVASPRNVPKLVLSPGPDGVPVATRAIGQHSLIVDSMVSSILDMKARGEKLQPGQEAMLKSLGRLDTSDLRVADRTVKERLDVGAVVPQHGVPVAVERTSQAYKDVVAELDRFNVGKGKGIKDREIVADAFFAITEDGVTPTFATHDGDVYKKLYSIKAAAEGLPAIGKLPKGVDELYAGGFTVTIEGRDLRVIPLSKR